MSQSKPIKPENQLLISDRAVEVLTHGLSGALAGCISTCFLYPIENVKTRMQAMAKSQKQSEQPKDFESGTDVETPKKNKHEEAKKPSINQTALQILEKEGFKGFYKGIVPYIVGTLASFGIYFFWYEFFKGHFIKGGFDAAGILKTSCISGAITTTATNPIWVVHTRILLEKDKKLSILKAIKSIIENEGLGGFFKGLGASYVLVLNPIVQFIIYEFLKKKFENTKSKTLLFFIAGAISKAIATFVTYPYQTLKTNLQANKGKNISQVDMIKQIYGERGLQGFFNGLGAKLSQTVINSALMLVIYEKLHRVISLLMTHLLRKRS